MGAVGVRSSFECFTVLPTTSGRFCVKAGSLVRGSFFHLLTCLCFSICSHFSMLVDAAGVGEVNLSVTEVGGLLASRVGSCYQGSAVKAGFVKAGANKVGS